LAVLGGTSAVLPKVPTIHKAFQNKSLRCGFVGTFGTFGTFLNLRVMKKYIQSFLESTAKTLSTDKTFHKCY
jgi:hypothetical protein